MPRELETTIAKRTKREKIQQRVALAITRLTAQSGRTTFAPEAVLLKRLELNNHEKWKPRYQLRQAVSRLEKKGLVRFQKGSSGWAVRLSPKGEQWVSKLETLERISIKHQKKWDGRWRIVIFDIWESRRLMRDRLRTMLQRAGFYKVQNSVWVYPYDCAELVALLRADMHLGQSVLYIVADGIEGDAKLREHFDLA